MKLKTNQIKPFESRLLVLPDEQGEVEGRAWRLVITPPRKRKEVFQGTVLTVGPGEKAQRFSPGDRIIYSNEAGMPFKTTEHERVLVVDCLDVIAVFWE